MWMKYVFGSSIWKGKRASEPINANEFQELARRALPKMYFDFYNGGAEDQHTLRENMEAFRRITFRPRVLVDVSRIDMSTTILGYPTSAPIMIAPTGTHKLAHPEGEVATARAAAACNTIMAMSFAADCTVEEVASSCNAIRFFQTYVCKRRDVTAVLVQRAERNGFKAIMLTVDTPRLGRREEDIKNKMIAPQPKNLEGLLSTEAVLDNGSKFAAFVAETLNPSLVEAIKAMEVGVAGIVDSNHGARQLDYSPATITVLEEVVRAVGGKIPVLIDGGVRHGTDIFKALALGAQAVMIGRPVLYGLAAKGENGVRRVIEMLKDELEPTMALSGCLTVKDITRSHVRTEYDRFNCRL
ncbi:peroxisomal (S)-2-hydroxy-acid oxidase GLO4-like isoform X2 [Camellia sinensis]|uniref:peroxisomal (S)-2-hydroxy-acid oxidase GLO4-like isoform X2 n=1 Tax=Camellia sinensis TaxID=4442 RepID=UPI00103555D5|nr:peroxisomal (S)-2-hydroxy-acid oxidase GLO4-like isoform X2 [Camellia sinensis]